VIIRGISRVSQAMPMSRLPRLEIPGVPQHVVVRGVDRQPLFFGFDDYRTFLCLLADASARLRCAIHAYALMTNHVHLLMTGDRPGSVASLMHRVGSRYVRRVNEDRGRTGTLFEGRYRACLVESDRYLLTCTRYIELNPMRAGMVDHPALYRWSSYRANAGLEPTGLIAPRDEYLQLGRSCEERAHAYRALFDCMIPVPVLDEIRLQLNRGCVLGSVGFAESIAQRSGRRAHVVDPGRPRSRGAATVH
jgi:putative transposase